MDINLDASLAAEADAQPETHHIVVGGERLPIPALSEWPIDVMRTWDRGGYADALEALLAPADWRKLLRHKLKLRHMQQILDGVARAGGFTSAGEPSASGGRSRGTTKPSKRTSKPATAST